MKSNTENRNGQKKLSQSNNNEHKKSRSKADQTGTQTKPHESHVEAGKKATEKRSG